MVKDRRTIGWRIGFTAGLAAILLVPSIVLGDESTVRLVDAGQSGVFNVGAGQATVTKSDGTGGVATLRIAYALPKGTAAGVWAKELPRGLDVDHQDVVQIDVEGVGPDQAKRVNAAIEIKGGSGNQRIDLDLSGGRVHLERAIDWSAIGAITEVVVAIGQVGDEPASGSILLDVSFARTPLLQRFLDSPYAKFAAVLLIAGLLALVEIWVQSKFGEGREVGFHAEGVRRDLVQGLGLAMIVGLALAIFEVGGIGPSGGNWWAIGFAVAGFAVGAWWKFGLAGRHSTPGEAFGDALALGFLGVSSSPLGILQAPANWSQVAQLSQAGASFAALAYLSAIAYWISTKGRRPGAIASSWIVGVPSALGSLVLLATPGMMRELGGIAWSNQPELQAAVGRVVVLFLFNVALAQGLSLATRRKLLGSGLAHLALLLVAIAAVAGRASRIMGRVTCWRVGEHGASSFWRWRRPPCRRRVSGARFTS